MEKCILVLHLHGRDGDGLVLQCVIQRPLHLWWRINRSYSTILHSYFPLWVTDTLYFAVIKDSSSHYPRRWLNCQPLQLELFYSFLTFLNLKIIYNLLISYGI